MTVKTHLHCSRYECDKNKIAIKNPIIINTNVNAKTKPNINKYDSIID